MKKKSKKINNIETENKQIKGIQPKKINKKIVQEKKQGNTANPFKKSNRPKKSTNQTKKEAKHKAPIKSSKNSALTEEVKKKIIFKIIDKF